MGTINFYITKRLVPWTICALLPLALILFYFYLEPFSSSPNTHFTHSNPININSYSSLSHYPSSTTEKKKDYYEKQCDYSNGEWVQDTKGPLYNDTTCSTIKEGRNCITHGRPDSDYLYWRWKPNQCNLSRFEPNTFLKFINNKHIAFIGDSIARNQLESLLCMLSTISSPKLIYQNTKGKDTMFSRWHFTSHNATFSLYWSPFLVHGIEKSSTKLNNELHLNHIDEKWGKDIDQMDMIVFSIGHWFLLPAMYYEGDLVLGCHYCPGLNHTEIGFYDALRKSLRTTLNSVIERRESKEKNEISVIVTTFSPHHFEGDWDKVGACPKTKPYGNDEKEIEGMDGEMRKVEIEEVEDAKKKVKGFGRVRFEVLDVTKLALLRLDGHSGPYMNPFPFLNGFMFRMIVFIGVCLNLLILRMRFFFG